jgi:enoyl-CoA hydratase/carnithine racemase
MRELTQVLYSREGPIARLTLNRPDQLNAMSPTLIEEALHVTEDVAASDARVLIVSGAGRAFGAGVDLKAASSPEYTREVHRRFSDQARAIAVLFETMPQATIAQVRGYCFTGALEVALGCDFILASEEATFADTHGKLGLKPGWGLSQRLPRRIGVQRAKEMSFTGRRVGAEEAVRIGLILEATTSEGLEPRVNELAELIASMQPQAIAAYKTLYRVAENVGLDEGLAVEAKMRMPRPASGEAPPLSSYLKS